MFVKKPYHQKTIVHWYGVLGGVVLQYAVLQQNTMASLFSYGSTFINLEQIST